MDDQQIERKWEERERSNKDKLQQCREEIKIWEKKIGKEREKDGNRCIIDGKTPETERYGRVMKKKEDKKNNENGEWENKSRLTEMTPGKDC